jgi:hypothetical protein
LGVVVVAELDTDMKVVVVAELAGLYFRKIKLYQY